MRIDLGASASEIVLVGGETTARAEAGVKWALVIGALSILASCDMPQKVQHDPVGRFQMLPSGNERHGVFILDTANGHVWLCDESPDASLTITCGVSQHTAQVGDV